MSSTKRTTSLRWAVALHLTRDRGSIAPAMEAVRLQSRPAGAFVLVTVMLRAFSERGE